MQPLVAQTKDKDAPAWIRSAKSGLWSAAATWEGGKVPAASARVHVRTGHTVTYDLHSDQAIRAIHVAGTMTFPRQEHPPRRGLDPHPGRRHGQGYASEEGFECDMHMPEVDAKMPRPALEVGSPEAAGSTPNTPRRFAWFTSPSMTSCRSRP